VFVCAEAGVCAGSIVVVGSGLGAELANASGLGGGVGLAPNCDGVTATAADIAVEAVDAARPLAPARGVATRLVDAGTRLG
jgi:hypothetical protein